MLDTDVWSHLYGRRGDHPDIPVWRAMLTGRPVVVSVQTRAEVIRGLIQRDLGQARRERIMGQLDETATIPMTRELADTYAHLAAAVTRAGHGLQAKDHTGDRWVAATAIHLDVPLLAVDGIYRNVPGLRLLDHEVPER